MDFCNHTEFDANNINLVGYVYAKQNIDQQKSRLDIFRDFTIPKGISYQYSNICLIVTNAPIDTTFIYLKGTYGIRNLIKSY